MPMSSRRHLKKNSANGAVGISFKRVAKNALISLNGRLALKFSPGQPQKTVAFITVALSACSLRLAKVWGRWASCGRTCDATLLKEIPTAWLSNYIFFNSLKCYKNWKIEELSLCGIDESWLGITGKRKDQGMKQKANDAYFSIFKSDLIRWHIEFFSHRTGNGFT